MPNGSAEAARWVKVWDPAVRLFHWLLVVVIALAFLSSEEESPLSGWHIPMGWLAAMLLVFRLVWGVVGGEHARFLNFIRPTQIGAHVRELLAGRPQAFLGHNPLGGLAVIALLGLIGVTVATGVGGGEGGHEAVAFALLGLVGLHVASVIVMSMLSNDNLVLAMVTGKKRAELHPGARDASPPPPLGLPIAAIVLGAAVYAATRIDPQAFSPHSVSEAGEGGERQEHEASEAGERDGD